MAITLYGPDITLTIDPDDDDTPLVVRSRCGMFEATMDYALKFHELPAVHNVDDALTLSTRQEHWLIEQYGIIEEALYDGPVGDPNFV